MPAIQFRSNSPLDHACRALDIVRRMGLSLGSLRTEPADGRCLVIALELDAMATSTLEQVAAHIANFPGATDVTCQKAPKGGAANRSRRVTGRNAEETRAAHV